MRFSIVFLFIVLLGSSAMENQTLGENHRRVRRKVVFTKNSKIFFRVNGKVNVIPYVQIFAYGYAVRVNWDLPETLHRRRKFFKRDLHTELKQLQLDGSLYYQTYACLVSYLCNQISRISTMKSGKCGILCSIGWMINESNGIEADFFKSIVDKCTYYIDACVGNDAISNNKEALFM